MKIKFLLLLLLLLHSESEEHLLCVIVSRHGFNGCTALLRDHFRRYILPSGHQVGGLLQ